MTYNEEPVPDEMWIELFNQANEKAKVKDVILGEYAFQYALINLDDGYNILPILEDDLNGRCEEYAFYGAGLPFIIENLIPEKDYGAYAEKDFIDYFALHEHIEAKTGSHCDACRAELGEVFKREQRFIDAYANMLGEIAEMELKILGSGGTPGRGYFGRCVPGFITTGRMEKGSTPLELLKYFKKELYKDLAVVQVAGAQDIVI